MHSRALEKVITVGFRSQSRFRLWSKKEQRGKMLPGNGVGVGVERKELNWGFFRVDGDICSEEGLFLIYDYGWNLSVVLFWHIVMKWAFVHFLPNGGNSEMATSTNKVTTTRYFFRMPTIFTHKWYPLALVKVMFRWLFSSLAYSSHICRQNTLTLKCAHYPVQLIIENCFDYFWKNS